MRSQPPLSKMNHVALLLKGGSYLGALAAGETLEQVIYYLRSIHPGYYIVRLHKGRTLVGIDPDTSLFTDIPKREEKHGTTEDIHIDQ